MAREIENYQDLQDAVRDWLNRDDLVARIPTFIYLAERKIFRRYRTPNNEKTITFDQRAVPDGGDPSQIILSETLAIPADYLETLTLQANGQPMIRKSLTEIQSRIDAGQGTNTSTVQGPPTLFARERRNLMIWPFPVGDTLFKFIYYCDLSGNLVDPGDDNDVLRTAPDLYIYGALAQAQPFLKPTDDEWQLLPTWKAMYEDAFGLIEYQRDEDERSGSVVTINSAFGSRSAVGAQFNGNS